MNSPSAHDQLDRHRDMGSPSALIAALAQAVLDQHAKRARLSAREVGMVGVPNGGADAGDQSRGVAAEGQKMPALTVIRGGRRE